MDFNVPCGQSASVNLVVKPAAPQDGTASQWGITDDSSGTPEPVDALDVNFSSNTPPRGRRVERMSFVFTIDPSVQSGDSTWRFAEEGIIYCPDGGDYLNDIKCRVEGNGSTLVMSIQSISNQEEQFSFRFLGILMDDASGECQLLASADPGGTIRRRN